MYLLGNVHSLISTSTVRNHLSLLSHCSLILGLKTDLFTHMIWVYFVLLHFQRMKMKFKNTIINISRHFCSLFVFPFRICPVLGFDGMRRSHDLSLP